MGDHIVDSLFGKRDELAEKVPKTTVPKSDEDPIVSSLFGKQSSPWGAVTKTVESIKVPEATVEGKPIDWERYGAAKDYVAGHKQEVGFQPEFTSAHRTQSEQDALPVPGKAKYSEHTYGAALDQRTKNLTPEQKEKSLDYWKSKGGVKAGEHNKNHIHMAYRSDEHFPDEDEIVSKLFGKTEPKEEPKEEEPKKEISSPDQWMPKAAGPVPPGTEGTKPFEGLGTKIKEIAGPVLDKYREEKGKEADILRSGGRMGHLGTMQTAEQVHAMEQPAYDFMPGAQKQTEQALALMEKLGISRGNPIAKVYSGYQQGLAENLTGLTSPENMAYMVAGGGAPKMVAGVFAPQLLYGGYESGKQGIQDVREGNWQDAARNLTGAGLQAGLGFLAGKHALKGVSLKGMPEMVKPTTSFELPLEPPPPGAAGAAGARRAKPVFSEYTKKVTQELRDEFPETFLDVEKKLEKIKPESKPEFILLGGLPASGKTGLAGRALKKQPNTLYVDPDTIKLEIGARTGFSKKYVKDNPSQFHRESSLAGKELIRRGLAEGKTVVYDVTLNGRNNIGDILELANQTGHKKKLIFISIPYAEGLARDLKRSIYDKERGIGSETYRSEFEEMGPHRNALEMQELFDDVLIIDNFVEPSQSPITLLKRAGKDITTQDIQGLEKLKEMAYAKVDVQAAEANAPIRAKQIADQFATQKQGAPAQTDDLGRHGGSRREPGRDHHGELPREGEGPRTGEPGQAPEPGLKSDLTDLPTKDLIKESFKEFTEEFTDPKKKDRGSFSFEKISPEREETLRRSHAARVELLKRVQAYVAETGKDLSEAIKDLGISPPQLRVLQSGEGAPPPQPLIAGTDLKTGKLVQDRLSYNPEKITGPEDVNRLFEGTAKASEEFRTQRISKTNEDIVELAKDVGLTPEQLIEARPGSIANSETTMKARQITMDLAQDLRDYLRTIDTATATPEQLAIFQTKLLRLQGTMKAIAGFRSEASHLFRQFQQEVHPNENPMLQSLLGEIKKVDVQAAEDLSAFTRKTRQVVEPTIIDKAWHLWYSSILSGGSTQLKNIFGNLTHMMAEVGRVGTTHPTELPAAIGGIYQGVITGWKKGIDIMKKGERSKFEEHAKAPVRFKGKMSFLNAADYVGRFMSAWDAVFREGFRGMEAMGLAREAALAEGLKGKALKNRMHESYDTYLESPEADLFANRGVYTSAPEGLIGVIAESISRASSTGPGMVIRPIVPFTRIVANVINRGLDWTPIGIKRAITPEGFTADIVNKLKGKEVKRHTARARNQQLARGVLGTIGMAYLGTLAADGIISGAGPSDGKRRNQLRGTGWIPNAIKIGDTWYPFTQMGPLAMPLALVGNYFDAVRYGNLEEKDLLNRVSAATLGSAKTVLDMSFLSGLADLIEAIGEPERKGAHYMRRWSSQQATSMVPNLVKQIGRYFDSTVYDTKSIKEQMLSNLRITGGLKPRLNVWGEEIKGDALTQLTPHKVTKDPLKLYMAENDLWIPVPSKATSIKERTTGERRPMTHDEYRNYIKYSGPMIYQALNARFGKIQALPSPEDKQDFIDDVVRKIRARIRKRIQGGYYK